MPTYDFNTDKDKVRWLRTAYKPHGKAMLDRWRKQKTFEIGRAKAELWMLDLIKRAKDG